ncbi:MAG TPA: hypothetical protein VGS19_36585 [Streptosporangiaceae bacterium]|nr:hypothetical protein [Streptosporangiaceae bacterium]
MTADRPDPGEYPQAIADDYPGWDIGYDGQWWTAACPAVQVQAQTPEGLRAALERVINPDAGTP